MTAPAVDTQNTYINVHRGTDGHVHKAELWAGFSFLEEEAVLLDIFDEDAGVNDAQYVGTAEAEEDDSFEVDGETITIKGRRPISELIASWISNPPTEPTKEVEIYGWYERHVQEQIDIARGK